MAADSFPWLAHRTMAEVAETERLRAELVLENNWVRPMSLANHRRLQVLDLKALAFNSIFNLARSGSGLIIP